MKLTIEHNTDYSYKDTVLYSTQYLRLTPRESKRQRILDWSIQTPEESSQTTDSFNNILSVITLDQPHQSISLKVKGMVEIELEDEDDDCAISPLVFLRSTKLTESDDAITDLAKSYANAGSLTSLESLSEKIVNSMPYTPGSTEVDYDAAAAFAQGRGVCQDHTHVFISCCRSLGIPARYVSGYLYTTDSTHVASHAWAEVWHNDKWNTFDITNQARHPSNHLKLAVGRDYGDACPVRGVRYGGGLESMQSVAIISKMQHLESDYAQNHQQ